MVAAVSVILVWGAVGPIFGFSDTWQLVINTGTTIVTFAMVFVVQHTQNRDSKAMQTKLDAILDSVQEHTDSRLLKLEQESEREIEAEHEKVVDSST